MTETKDWCWKDVGDGFSKRVPLPLAETTNWIYEDELPEGYPYDAMYPFSKVDGVRLFPALTRENVRNMWISARLTKADLTLGRLQKLRRMIDAELKTSALMGGTFRVQGNFKVGITYSGFFADLKCKSHYFEKRQCVTFEGNGFVGFAGWSDEHNVQPILSAFANWVEWMKSDCNKPEEMKK